MLKETLLASYDVRPTGNLYARKEELKELKLRIVRQPLTMNKVSNSTNCCLCCKDLMEPLDAEERVLKLTSGFVRKYADGKAPAVICQLCMSYVGDSGSFDILLLSSNERRKECCKSCLFTACCCCDKCIQICAECHCIHDFKDICYRIFCVLFAVLLIIACIFGKDIAGLVIYSYIYDDCKGTMKGIAFNVNEWILGASISHISFWVILAFWIYLIYRSSSFYSSFTVRCYFCSWLFFIAWTVIGFLFYSKMDGNTTCSNMVLSWCILECVEFVIPICSIFLLK
eukprot:89983_1